MSTSRRMPGLATGPKEPPAQGPRGEPRAGPPPILWFLAAMGVMGLALILIRLPGATGRPDGARATPADRPSPGPSLVLAQPPRCTTGDLLAPFSGYDQWDRTLLDTSMGLPSSYS